MVYDPAPYDPKRLTHAILTADLTSAELLAVHEQYALGATMCSPYTPDRLFITDKRSWASLSHLEIWRATPSDEDDWESIIIIDANTPHDGGIWYIDGIAKQTDVDIGEAVSTNTLFKVRMAIGEIPLCRVNYDIGNISIRETMDAVNIPYPTPEDFIQEKMYSSGFGYVESRYLNPTWITAEPHEMEESRDLGLRMNFIPQPDVVYRLKEEVARANGLKVKWMIGSDQHDDKFPSGSKILQLDYDPETVIPRYEKPEGSL